MGINSAFKGLKKIRPWPLNIRQPEYSRDIKTFVGTKELLTVNEEKKTKYDLQPCLQPQQQSAKFIEISTHYDCRDVCKWQVIIMFSYIYVPCHCVTCLVFCLFVFWFDSLQWAMASSFMKFRDHTQRRTMVGRTPLDEWSARRRDLYLTTHNTHNRQTSMLR